MHIFITIRTGKSFCIEIDNNTTVNDLKRHIEDTEGIPLKQQCPMIAGKHMNNMGGNVSLSFWGACDGSEVYIGRKRLCW